MSKFSDTRNDLFMRFIDYRTASNIWNTGYDMNLIYFDRYCSEHFPQDDGITQEMIDGWCKQRDTENKASLIGRTLSARKLVEYLNERGLVSLKIPEMPPLPPKQHIPHSFTEEEIKNFFTECDSRVLSAKGTAKKFRALEVSVMFRLLYSTGMRTTEARLLRVVDVDLVHALINIRKSKNSIEHYIALHSSTAELMKQYEAAAEKVMPDREIYFPCKDAATPFTADMVTWEFHKVWDSVNAENAVPYDFRHNYAIQNINSWLSEGLDFNNKFLYLSKSMGHTSLESTRYYYSIVPSMANIIEQKSGDSFDDIIPEVPDDEE